MIDKKLIDKLLREECSQEELERLQQYWEGEDHTAVDEILKDNWQSVEQESEEEDAQLKVRLWRAITKARNSITDSPSKVHWRGRRGLSWAAAAAVLLLIGAGLFKGVWPIKSAQPGWVEQENRNQASMKVALEDGSVVWLKRHGKISYRYPFEGSKREVKLLGEAYFEIAKDLQRPFIVQTGRLRTRVLGTAFNLKALEADTVVRLALVEGSVEARWTKMQQDTAVRVKPGEQLTYHRHKQHVEKERFLADAPYAWKNGIIYFVKADVWEVARTLEQWYGKTFVIKEGSSITSTIVYRFDAKKLTLDEVLNGISTVMDYRFEEQADDRILILPK